MLYTACEQDFYRSIRNIACFAQIVHSIQLTEYTVLFVEFYYWKMYIVTYIRNGVTSWRVAGSKHLDTIRGVADIKVPPRLNEA